MLDRIVITQDQANALLKELAECPLPALTVTGAMQVCGIVQHLQRWLAARFAEGGDVDDLVAVDGAQAEEE
jgi:hypothetical protein